MNGLPTVNIRELLTVNPESHVVRGFVRIKLVEENLTCLPSDWPEQALEIKLKVNDLTITQ